MANVKISDLPAASSAAGTNQLETNQSGVTRRVTMAQIAQYARDSLSLKDYGAIGDGVADDTTAINTWWLAVCTTGNAGYIPPGTYRCTGTMLDLNLNVAGGTSSRVGGVVYGAGARRSIIDVQVCTGSPQFRLKDTSGAAFYWSFRDFGIRCNTSGIGAQFGRDWSGSSYPDFLNSFTFHKIVVTNGAANADAALRLNGVLQSSLDIVANNGGCGVGDAIQLYGVQFCSGLLAAGNAANGLHLSGYTYGNSFVCDVEVVNSCILADNAVGAGGPTRNEINGVFVWGATNANPAISGNDGTTDCVVATYLGGALTFGTSSQFGSATEPQVTGAVASLVAFAHRNLGTWDVGALRIARPVGQPAVVNLDAETAQSVQLQFRRNGNMRWNLVRDTTAEAGSNAGSLLTLQAFADNGITNLGNAVSFERGATGGPRTNISRLWCVSDMQIPAYTVATLPSASQGGRIVYVSDEAGGAVPAFSDGANWRRVTDRAIVS